MKPLSKKFLLGLAFAWGGLGVLSATVDLANGLVGHWSFDEVNGTTVKDSSGNDRHGTLVNMDSATDYVDGKVNKAIDLDGSNDYVSIPTFEIGEEFSFYRIMAYLIIILGILMLMLDAYKN